MLHRMPLKKKLQVMVVDDTITYRMITKKVAESIPGVRVISTASNGKLAFDKLVAASASERPDVVLLDVEMPVWDGITTLKKIRERFSDIPVVMISALSRSNANIIVECLNAGALDFVTKPLETMAEHAKKALRKDLEPILFLVIQNLSSGGKASHASVGSRPAPVAVVPVAVASRRVTPKPEISRKPVPKPVTSSSHGQRVLQRLTPQERSPVRPGKQSVVDLSSFHPDLVLIGSSTGGPAALTKVLSSIARRGTPPVPILIVQHMPPIFTASLAAQLSRASGLTVTEAEDDRILAPGSITLAKGGRHMSVRRRDDVLVARVNDGPKVNECRPAVDVLFLSVVAEFSGQVLAVILTGMGRDGTNGVDALKRAGKTYCITQEKSSCVVYGMPRSVDEKGLSDVSLPLEEIGPKIAEICFN